MSPKAGASRGLIPTTRVPNVRLSQRALTAEVVLDDLGLAEVRLNLHLGRGDAEVQKALQPLLALLESRARQACARVP